MTNRRRSMMVTLVAVFSVALVVVLFFPAEPTSLFPSSAHPSSSATSLAHNISTMSQPTLSSVVRPSTEPITPAPHIPLVCTTTWHEEYNESHTWGDPGERYTKKGCPSRRQSISCTGTRMHRALVIYMLQTKDDANDVIVEMENFRYFLNYGVHGENQSTAMFDGVDYIFTRIRPKSMGHVTVPTVCASAANVKMMWVPDGVCDLCAHGRVIASLGGPAAVVAKYAFIVLMNAGARGPFQGETDPNWIDVFAMGGQTQWRQGITRPLMTGPSVSTQFSVHVQTHVLGLHAQLLFQYMEFLTHCTIRKKECIRRGEIPAGIAWLHSGGWLHSLSRNEHTVFCPCADACVGSSCATTLPVHGVFNPLHDTKERMHSSR
ncbi:membrane-associated protein, putative [Bodo saltans]|uniref:Membrane-associated protein, putative n=1 Tax=Bodo saltans TaxID=75058 RepID=A0A0S4JTA3_BODSA|nr:membrane-associated protein, putative [Bodo saltans]|eukprot:CUG92338.1 membrane-associated protein, putative [Bodo saltans]